MTIFPHASSFARGVFAFAVVALIFGALFQSQSSFQAQGQDLVKTAEDGTADASASALPPAAQSFLALAESVGETVPAQRLIDYKLKTDPFSQPRYYAVVDFGQPSTTKRLYVFDTIDKKVERYYVAHGRGSEGRSGTNIPALFSNQNGSNSSSLGIYRTLNEYNGHHGRSLRLNGLEATNSNALARAVVLHTADYVSDAFIRQTGHLGRSEGCFAVEKSAGDTLIDELKDGAYIIAAKG
jgi:hypothetical protein